MSVDAHVRAQPLYLVFRVDKILSGGITHAAEKYLKVSASFDAKKSPSSTDLKVGSTLQKSMQSFCKNLGRYRMPFAWGARYVFSIGLYNFAMNT